VKALAAAEQSEATRVSGAGAARGLAMRVLVVDDHPAVRAGVRGLLLAQRDVASVTAVPNARDAVAAAREQEFDVAVVDYHLPDRDGLSLTRQLNSLANAPGVLLYSAFADTQLAVAALVAGAGGICSKERGDLDLWDAVRAVAAGVPALPAIRPDAMRAIGSALDEEDLPIVAMLIDRVAPEEIAVMLGVSRGWLEARRWAILQQLMEPRHTDAQAPHVDSDSTTTDGRKPREPIRADSPRRSIRHPGSKR